MTDSGFKRAMLAAAAFRGAAPPSLSALLARPCRGMLPHRAPQARADAPPGPEAPPQVSPGP